MRIHNMDCIIFRLKFEVGKYQMSGLQIHYLRQDKQGLRQQSKIHILIIPTCSSYNKKWLRRKGFCLV